MRALRLLSGVTYPFLTRPDEFVPDLGRRAQRQASRAKASTSSTSTSTAPAGLKSLFNTWARSTTSADKMAIAGSINVVVFTNLAESIVHSGAVINQDPFYRPDPRFYLQPGDPGYDPDYAPEADGIHGNDNITHSANANNVDEHVVSIEATNYMQFMNVTGVFGFHLPSLELELRALGERLRRRGHVVRRVAHARRHGGKGGVGGAIFLQFLNNTTHAIVEPGVQLYSGQQSGLNIKAEEAIMGFAFSQAGADAGKVAVGGTFAYFEQHSDTLAQLAQGSVITGGRVDVYAGSLETVINWAGGVAKSKAIGVGIAVAINNTHRSTRAVIGEAEDTAGTAAGGLPDAKIDVVGAVTARASVAGGLWTFTVAGAAANASKSKDKPAADAAGNAPAAGSDPAGGVTPPSTSGQQPPTTAAQDKKAGTSVAIAAAVAVNNITDVTQASLADYNLTADAVDVKANNRNSIVAATGGLAFAKTDSGGNAAALAGAFSYNGIDATVDAFVRDAALTLRSVPFEDFVVETATQRFSLTADSAGKVWTLAAGGAGAVASGGEQDSSGGSAALSLAGSVSLNTITANTSARMVDSTIHLEAGLSPSDVRIRATDTSDIFAIAGGLSLAIANGGQGKATAISAGVAIAVNTIVADVEALVESVNKPTGAWWLPGATGTFLVEALSSARIQAYTVAGALAAAVAKQSGSGIAATGAGSGSINNIDADVTAKVHNSTIDNASGVTVHARNDSQITAGAGAVAISFASAGQGTAAAVAIGGSFAVNIIDGDGLGNLVWAEIDHSDVTSGGPISVYAEMLAGIFALGIGAAGGVAGSGSGSAFAVSLAGSIGYNRTRNNTRARVSNGSHLTSTGNAAAIVVQATDASWINATAGAVAVSIAVSQKTAVAAALGLSLTINEITNSTSAGVVDSELDSDKAITVSASSTSRIDSLSFGIAVAVGISGSATAIGVGATGAISFNTINNVVSATIANSATNGTATAASRGSALITFCHGAPSTQSIVVEACDDSAIKAIAIAAAASVAGSTSATAVSVAVGLALAHNKITKTVAASIVNMPSVVSHGGIVVSAHDGATIEVTTVAAAVAIAISGGGTSVGVAGGAAESTNVILTHTLASIENSEIDSRGPPLGTVDVLADSTSTIKAVVAGVAVSVAIGNTGVGVAIGIAVARNFIGYNPDSAGVSYSHLSTDYVDTLTPGLRVKIAPNPATDADGNQLAPQTPMDGDIFEYLGPPAAPRYDYTASEQHAKIQAGRRVKVGSTVYEYIGSHLIGGVETDVRNDVDLSLEDFSDATKWRAVSVLDGQDYLNPRLWRQVNLHSDPAQVEAYIKNTSILGSAFLHVKATGSADDRRARHRRRRRDRWRPEQRRRRDRWRGNLRRERHPRDRQGLRRRHSDKWHQGDERHHRSFECGADPHRRGCSGPVRRRRQHRGSCDLDRPVPRVQHCLDRCRGVRQERPHHDERRWRHRLGHDRRRTAVQQQRRDGREPRRRGEVRQHRRGLER